MNDEIARIDAVAVANVPANHIEIGGDSVERIPTNNDVTVTSPVTTRVPQTTGTTPPTQLPNNNSNDHDDNDDGDDDSSSIDIDMDEVLFKVKEYLDQKNDDENTPEQALAKAEKKKNRAMVMRIEMAIADDPNLSEEEKGPALREAANHPLASGYFESAGFIQVNAQDYEEYEALKQDLAKNVKELWRLTTAK